jgi:hypothetical protein
VECAPGTDPLLKYFIRNDSAQVDSLKFYDIGNFTIATTGMQSASVIGELWVSYEVELSEPNVPASGLGSFSKSETYSMYSSTGDPFGPDADYVPNINMLGSYIQGNTLTIPETAPRGRYLVNVSWAQKGGTLNELYPWNFNENYNGIVIGGAAQFAPVYYNDTVGTSGASPYNRIYQAYSMVVCIDVVGPGAATIQFQIGLGGVVGGGFNCDLNLLLVSSQFGAPPPQTPSNILKESVAALRQARESYEDKIVEYEALLRAMRAEFDSVSRFRDREGRESRPESSQSHIRRDHRDLADNTRIPLGEGGRV